MFKKKKLKFDESLEIMFKLLRFIGLRFLEDVHNFKNERMKRLNDLHLCLCLFVFVVLFIVPSFLFVLLQEIPFESRILALCIGLMLSDTILKVFSILWNRKQINVILTTLKKQFDDVEIISPAKKRLIQTAKLMKLWIYLTLIVDIIYQSAVIFISMYMVIIQGCAMGLFPYDLWMPFDQSKHYALVYIYELIIGYNTIIFYFGIDAFVIMMLALMSWQS